MSHNIPFIFQDLDFANGGSSQSSCSKNTLRLLGPYFRPHISKAIGYIFLPILLAGCVGSEILVKNQEALNRPFPQLETVPERPVDLGKEEREQNLEELDHLASDKWSLNQNLRDQYKLETAPCQK